MVDVVDSATRSRMMAGIKGKNTKPEMRLRSALHRAGYRFRLHCKDLPGKPDIVLKKYRTVIFVHGCFWHRHKNCHLASTPATRPEFWSKKFKGNVARDARNVETLERLGWMVIISWECNLRKDIDGETDRISTLLAGAIN